MPAKAEEGSMVEQIKCIGSPRIDDKVSGKHAQRVEKGGIHATSARDFRSRAFRNAGHGPADGSADSYAIGDGGYSRTLMRAMALPRWAQRCWAGIG